MKLISVFDPEEKLPYSKATLYKWHSMKKYPGIIFKVGGRLYFDLDKWDQFAEQSREKHIQESARVYRERA